MACVLKAAPRPHLKDTDDHWCFKIKQDLGMEPARGGWNKDERNGCKYTVVSASLFDTNVCSLAFVKWYSTWRSKGLCPFVICVLNVSGEELITTIRKRHKIQKIVSDFRHLYLKYSVKCCLYEMTFNRAHVTTAFSERLAKKWIGLSKYTSGWWWLDDG